MPNSLEVILLISEKCLLNFENRPLLSNIYNYQANMFIMLLSVFLCNLKFGKLGEIGAVLIIRISALKKCEKILD